MEVDGSWGLYIKRVYNELRNYEKYRYVPVLFPVRRKPIYHLPALGTWHLTPQENLWEDVNIFRNFVGGFKGDFTTGRMPCIFGLM